MAVGQRTVNLNAALLAFAERAEGLVYDKATGLDLALRELCNALVQQLMAKAARVEYFESSTEDHDAKDGADLSPSISARAPSIGRPLRLLACTVGPAGEASANTQVWSIRVPLDHGAGLEFQFWIYNRVARKAEIYLDVMRDKIIAAVRLNEERRFERAYSQITARYITDELQPSKGWQALADHMLAFLPDFSPLHERLKGTLCQILTLEREHTYLMLRASSVDQSCRPERSQTEEALAQTDQRLMHPSDLVCGVVVEGDLDEYVTNPSIEHTDRYANYLFPDSAAQSEAVFAIRDPDTGKIVAVVNFEHPEDARFRGYVVTSMRAAVKRVASFVVALLQREQRVRDKETGGVRLTVNMLNRLRYDLQHAIGNHQTKASAALDRAQTESQRNVELAQFYFERTRNQIELLADTALSFVSSAERNLELTAINLREAVEVAATYSSRQVVGIDSNWAQIEVQIPAEIQVLSSGVLEVCVQDLLSNSLHAIRERLDSGDDRPGVVKVTASLLPMVDLHGRRVDGPGRIALRIEDNGCGVRPDDLPRIAEYKFTTRGERGGTGYGLSAAIEYIQNVGGGGIHFDNLAAGGFYFSCSLLQYDPSLLSGRATLDESLN